MGLACPARRPLPRQCLGQVPRPPGSSPACLCWCLAVLRGSERRHALPRRRPASARAPGHLPSLDAIMGSTGPAAQHKIAETEAPGPSPPRIDQTNNNTTAHAPPPRPPPRCRRCRHTLVHTPAGARLHGHGTQGTKVGQDRWWTMQHNTTTRNERKMYNVEAEKKRTALTHKKNKCTNRRRLVGQEREM